MRWRVVFLHPSSVGRQMAKKLSITEVMIVVMINYPAMTET